MNVTAGNITANSLVAQIDNTTGSIGGNATVNVSAASISAGYLESIIFNQGGNIGGSATVSFNVSGNLTSTQSDEVFGIVNRNGGIIGSNATIDVTAASISTAGFLNPVINNNAAGVIHGNATNTVDATGDINATGGFYFVIADTGFQNTDSTYTGGRIDGNATVALQGQNIITPSTASGTIGVDIMALEAAIYTNVNGTVGGDAAVSVTALQDISVAGTALFWVANGNYQNLGPGTIGGSATVNVNAANISTGDLFLLIENFNGASIGGDATLNVSAALVDTSAPLRRSISTFPAALASLMMQHLRFLVATVRLPRPSILMAVVMMPAGRSLPSPTELERSHSILPAFTQMCSKWARLAQTVCSISAAAPSRLIRR